VLARSLAGTLSVTPPRASGRRRSAHLRRLDQHIALLSEVYRAVADDVHREVPISPSSEWLLDNFHLVASEARSIRRNLPRGYYRRLPGASAVGHPAASRIEILAGALVAHSDGRLEADRVRGFLLAFQSVTPLTIGELWAWPSALEATLIERVAAIARRIQRVRAAHATADVYVDALGQPDGIAAPVPAHESGAGRPPPAAGS
jgi:cyclic beta-1,2-glucan synthetase